MALEASDRSLRISRVGGLAEVTDATIQLFTARHRRTLIETLKPGGPGS